MIARDPDDGLRPFSIDDLYRREAEGTRREFPCDETGTIRHGRWSFHRAGFYLMHADSGGYEIGVERLDSCPAVLDWIAQVSEKTWCSRADVGDFVALLNHLIGLQAVLCSCGQEGGPIDTRAVVAQKLAARAELLREYGVCD